LGCPKWFAGPAPLASQLNKLGVSGSLARPFWRRFLCFFWLAASRGLPGQRRTIHSSSVLVYLVFQPDISDDKSFVSCGLLPAVTCRAGAACSTAQQTWRIRRVSPAFLVALSLFPF
jgi:hypothetical protein